MRQIAIEIIHAECYTGNPSPSLLINHYHDIAESDRVTVAAAEAVERTIKKPCGSSPACGVRYVRGTSKEPTSKPAGVCVWGGERWELQNCRKRVSETESRVVYDRRLPDYEF